MSAIEELIQLLDYPTFLKEKVKELKQSTTTSEEIQGFIELYDFYEGDCQKIKRYLNDSKKKITQIKRKKETFNWIKYAAILIIIIGIGGGYFMYEKESKNYYKTYVTPDLGLPVFMSINKSELDNWMIDYKDKKYNKALEKGLSLYRENKTNDTILYYLGVIYLELNAPSKANSFFSQINTNTSTYTEKKEWLSAICYLSTDKNKAKKLLISIEKENGIFSSKAKEILNNEF
jgi:hypothetical protein